MATKPADNKTFVKTANLGGAAPEAMVFLRRLEHNKFVIWLGYILQFSIVCTLFYLLAAANIDRVRRHRGYREISEALRNMTDETDVYDAVATHCATNMGYQHAITTARGTVFETVVQNEMMQFETYASEGDHYWVKKFVNIAALVCVTIVTVAFSIMFYVHIMRAFHRPIMAKYSTHVYHVFSGTLLFFLACMLLIEFIESTRFHGFLSRCGEVGYFLKNTPIPGFVWRHSMTYVFKESRDERDLFTMIHLLTVFYVIIHTHVASVAANLLLSIEHHWQGVHGAQHQIPTSNFEDVSAAATGSRKGYMANGRGRKHVNSFRA